MKADLSPDLDDLLFDAGDTKLDGSLRCGGAACVMPEAIEKCGLRAFKALRLSEFGFLDSVGNFVDDFGFEVLKVLLRGWV